MRSTVFGYLLLYWASATAGAQTSPPLDPAPLYVESSITNSASARAEVLAPNTLGTIFGQFLSRVTRTVSADEITSGTLPTTLRGSGVRVLIGGILTPLLYVSPTQVNFVVPSNVLPGNTEIRLGIDSRYGPAVRMRLAETSPALFPIDPEFAIMARQDGSVAQADNAARAGEIVVLYATGLGLTTERIDPGQLVRAPAVLQRIREFSVYLNGVAVEASRILYAGLAPGFAGLYQINLRLPELAERNPEVRVGFRDVMSQEGLRIRYELTQPAAHPLRLWGRLH